FSEAKLIKSSLKPYKACGFHKAEPVVAHRSERNTPMLKPFARGEFQNSPGDCFGRGDALAESVP
ncbi:MAG: hypothetical protein II931_04620, partial [Clostridia bacterium]|nr:hypothetical protein [Clostridia bacterium]